MQQGQSSNLGITPGLQKFYAPLRPFTLLGGAAPPPNPPRFSRGGCAPPDPPATLLDMLVQGTQGLVWFPVSRL